MTLESIMTRHVVTVGMDDSLETVQNLFDRFSHLQLPTPEFICWMRARQQPSGAEEGMERAGRKGGSGLGGGGHR